MNTWRERIKQAFCRGRSLPGRTNHVWLKWEASHFQQYIHLLAVLSPSFSLNGLSITQHDTHFVRRSSCLDRRRKQDIRGYLPSLPTLGCWSLDTMTRSKKNHRSVIFWLMVWFVYLNTFDSLDPIAIRNEINSSSILPSNYWSCSDLSRNDRCCLFQVSLSISLDYSADLFDLRNYIYLTSRTLLCWAFNWRAQHTS